jgi:hypothetical protein
MTTLRQVNLKRLTFTISNNVGSGVTVAQISRTPGCYGYCGTRHTWIKREPFAGLPPLPRSRRRRLKRFLKQHSQRRRAAFARINARPRGKEQP